MPAWVKDKTKWDKAKEVWQHMSPEDKKGKDKWPYITGIYKNMGGKVASQPIMRAIFDDMSVKYDLPLRTVEALFEGWLSSDSAWDSFDSYIGRELFGERSAALSDEGEDWQVSRLVGAAVEEAAGEIEGLGMDPDEGIPIGYIQDAFGRLARQYRMDWWVLPFPQNDLREALLDLNFDIRGDLVFLPYIEKNVYSARLPEKLTRFQDVLDSIKDLIQFVPPDDLWLWRQKLEEADSMKDFQKIKRDLNRSLMGV